MFNGEDVDNNNDYGGYNDVGDNNDDKAGDEEDDDADDAVWAMVGDLLVVMSKHRETPLLSS